MSRFRLDMLKTNRLDRLVRKCFPAALLGLVGKPIRLAVLGSSTMDHLLPAFRVGALRRGLWLETFQGEYGQSLQELLDETTALHRFAPDTVLFCLDAAHLFGAADPAMTEAQADALLEQAAENIASVWRMARGRFGCHVIQQTILPVFLPLIGGNEHRPAGSAASLVSRMNQRLRAMAEAEGGGSAGGRQPGGAQPDERPQGGDQAVALTDNLADDATIALIIGREEVGGALLIDTGLMSCRVLGRLVEQTTLNLLAEEAARRGLSRIIGEYRPTAKNGMVREHYGKLGFHHLGETEEGGSRWELPLSDFTPFPTAITVKEGALCD